MRMVLFSSVLNLLKVVCVCVCVSVCVRERERERDFVCV